MNIANLYLLGVTLLSLEKGTNSNAYTKQAALQSKDIPYEVLLLNIECMPLTRSTSVMDKDSCRGHGEKARTGLESEHCQSIFAWRNTAEPRERHQQQRYFPLQTFIPWDSCHSLIFVTSELLPWLMVVKFPSSPGSLSPASCGSLLCRLRHGLPLGEADDTMMICDDPGCRSNTQGGHRARTPNF